MTDQRLETVDDHNWVSFTAAPLAVLVVTNPGCTHCRGWKEELSQFLSHDENFTGVRFGVITLDNESVAEFEESNKEWLDIIDGVPFNAIYVNGAPRTSFYGNGVGRLKNRLKKLSDTGNQ